MEFLFSVARCPFALTHTKNNWESCGLVTMAEADLSTILDSILFPIGIASEQSRDFEFEQNHRASQRRLVPSVPWFDFRRSAFIPFPECSCLFCNQPKISSIKKLIGYIIHCTEQDVLWPFLPRLVSDYVLLATMSGRRFLCIYKNKIECVSIRLNYFNNAGQLFEFSSIHFSKKTEILRQTSVDQVPSILPFLCICKQTKKI